VRSGEARFPKEAPRLGAHFKSHALVAPNVTLQAVESRQLRRGQLQHGVVHHASARQVPRVSRAGGVCHERCLIFGRLLLEEGLVDVGDHTTARDGRLDERVELLVTADLRETQMRGRAKVRRGQASGRRRASCRGRKARAAVALTKRAASSRPRAAMARALVCEAWRRGGGDRVHQADSAYRKLQVAGRDALDAEILGSVAGKLEHLGGEVLQDGGRVHSRRRANAALVGHAHLEVAVDAADRELQARLRGARDRLLGLQLRGITLDLGRHIDCAEKAGRSRRSAPRI